MAFDAQVFKIMLASPSDVAEERQIAREVIHEWNCIHAENRRQVLLPVGWETHATPTMGERPQEVINRQVLRDCDLLVAIFWTRIGSHTGKSVSGTVEEIEEHIASKKAAMLYFSDSPIVPGSVDLEQYAALNKLKAEYLQKGVIKSYGSKDEFRREFTRQLAQKVIESFPPASLTEPVEVKDVMVDNIPSLSELEKRMLHAAMSSPNKMIGRSATMDGTEIGTRDETFTREDDLRSVAQAEHALRQLQRHGLLEDPTSKRQIFRLTEEGYRVAERLDGSKEYKSV